MQPSLRLSRNNGRTGRMCKFILRSLDRILRLKRQCQGSGKTRRRRRMLLNSIVNGFFLGGLYASTALGLTLVFGVMRLVNLAHGELLVGSSYLALVLS